MSTIETKPAPRSISARPGTSRPTVVVDDVARFGKLWALAVIREKPAPDYYFSFSRGPQLTNLEVVVRRTPPGRIALYGAKVDFCDDGPAELTGELGGPGGLSWNARDGEAGNDDYEPAGPNYNPGFSVFEIEHADKQTPLLAGNEKTARSVAHAADKAHKFGGYTKQQSIAMLTRLCLGERDFSAGEAMKILNELWGVIQK